VAVDAFVAGDTALAAGPPVAVIASVSDARGWVAAGATDGAGAWFAWADAWASGLTPLVAGVAAAWGPLPVVAFTAWLTGSVVELTTDWAALATGSTALATGAAAAWTTVDAGPVTAEAMPESPGGGSSVAAWACLERSNRRKRIPAAAIANCTALTAV
jgi:hypothetical protein